MTATVANNSPQVKGLTQNTHQDLTNFQTTQKSSITAATDQYKKDKDHDSFMKTMEEHKAAAKKAADALIDKMYNKAEQIGENHPHLQTPLENVCGTIEAFITGEFLQGLLNFIENLAEQIAEWIENVAEKIGSFFEDAANKVGNFFSSIF